MQAVSMGVLDCQVPGWRSSGVPCPWSLWTEQYCGDDGNTVLIRARAGRADHHVLTMAPSCSRGAIGTLDRIVLKLTPRRARSFPLHAFNPRAIH